MLRRNRQIKMQIQQMLDACLFGASFWMAWVLRSNPFFIDLFNLKPVHTFDAFFWLYLVLIVVGPLMLEAQGFYDRPMLFPRQKLWWALLKGCFVTTMALIIVIFFLHFDFARGMAILFGTISFILVSLKEELVRFGLKSKFTRSQFQRRFILVGTPHETAQMRQELNSTPEEGIRVVMELDLNDQSIDELGNLLHEHSVNGVIVNARHNYFEKVEGAIRTCELEGIEVWLVADFFKTQISHTSFDDFHGRPVLVFRTMPDAGWQRIIKPFFDFSVSLAALVLLSPIFVFVGILIKLGSRGPVLFKQQRSGLNGQPFTIYKFRTMEVDAEKRKQELQALNEMSGPVFKITNDPRVTSIGRRLRKYSIDEWPQLFNVLRGEMSLVGPRPLPVDEVKRFDDVSYRRRLSVRPGLTCLWQVSGRNNVSDFKDWVRLDLEYIDNWSFWLDLKILWLTVPVVLIGTGAK